jgi:hypothetical protein
MDSYIITMRKIFLIIGLILTSFLANSQGTVRYLGTPQELITVRGSMKVDSVFAIPSDTLMRAGWDSTKRWISAKGDSLYIWSPTQGMYVLAGGSGGGGSNNYPTSLTYTTATGLLTLGRNGLSNLTATINKERLGIEDVTTSQNRYTTFSNTYNMTLDSLNFFMATTRNEYSKLSLEEGLLELHGGDATGQAFVNLYPDQLEMIKGDSRVYLVNDSIIFQQANGNYRFRSVATGATSDSVALISNRQLKKISRTDLLSGSLQNITGLVTAGTNVTITGTGTSGDPYVVNSSGGAGSGTVNSGTQYRLGYYATTGTAISEAAAITASRALISDVNGVPTHSAVTTTELGYVSGVTSAIQTQIGAKQPNIQYKDEGVNAGTSGGVTTVDFTGAGVTATESAGTLTVNITSGGGSSLTSTYVGYGDGSNALTGEAAFNYDATNNRLGIGAVAVAKLDITATSTGTIGLITGGVSNNTVGFISGYAVDRYLPGFVWHNSDDNTGVPKAGIYSQVTNSGSKMFFGTSANYAVGMNVTPLILDYSGDATIARDLLLTRNAHIGGYARMPEQATPSTPASGFAVVYPKTDGLWYGEDDAGTETKLSNEVTLAGAETLTNKRITKRTATSATSASLTINGDAVDMYTVTALAEAMTINAPTGTPTEGQTLLIRIKDNGTARALTFNAIFRAGTDIALPTTTVINKTMYLSFVYNTADTKWDFVGFVDNI